MFKAVMMLKITFKAMLLVVIIPKPTLAIVRLGYLQLFLIFFKRNTYPWETCRALSLIPRMVTRVNQIHIFAQFKGRPLHIAQAVDKLYSLVEAHLWLQIVELCNHP